MKDADIQFLEENPVARKLYYHAAQTDLRRATEMVGFLREAYLRGFVVNLSVEVQGVSAGIQMVFRKSGPDFELYNYLQAWIDRMKLSDQVLLYDMERIWPELSSWWVELQKEKGGGKIASQGP